MKEKKLGSEKETTTFRRSYLCFRVFTFSIAAHSISEEVAGFSPLWFPLGKLFVSLVPCVFIAVHVILSIKDTKIIMLA